MSPQYHTAANPIDIGALLSNLDTGALRAIASTAIDILDDRAGDCDLEDDDPAGDILDERGEPQTENGGAMLATKPKYGVDQSRGPINERAAYQAHQAAELGLVRTARGTWAYPA